MNPTIQRLRSCSAAILICAIVWPTATHAAAISIDLVPVGDAGNVGEQSRLSGFGDQTYYGAVSYNYNIATYDVTLTQYTAFLNAVAATDTNNLYNSSMAADLNVAGISRSGISGGYSYAVIGDGQRPVTYVSWYDAARFTNWLTNGQGSGGTETGVYTLNGLTSISGTLPADHSALVGTGTKWFLPTENEWYKAAYYQGGNTNAYWAYPFQRNTQPTLNLTPGASNSANFRSPTTGYAVTQLTSYSGSQNYLTDVGAYTSALSHYGSYDMGGDVFQWTETLLGSSRVRRGGYWDDYSSLLAASVRLNSGPTIEEYYLGFRVAELPEPGSLTLFVVGAVGFLALAWRRSHSRRAAVMCT